MYEGAEMVLEVKADRDGPLLRLNDYKVPKTNSEPKLLEQAVILKAITASVQQLEKKSGSLEYEKRLLVKTSEQQMIKYSEQKTVVGRSREDREMR